MNTSSGVDEPSADVVVFNIEGLNDERVRKVEWKSSL